MVVIGGWGNTTGSSNDGQGTDPWVNGMLLFDMTALTWSANYDAGAPAYVRADALNSSLNGQVEPSDGWAANPGLQAIFTLHSASSTTTASPTPTPTPKTDVGAIAGGVVGGVVALLLVSLLAWWLLRRRRRSRDNLHGSEKGLMAHELEDTQQDPERPQEMPANVPVELDSRHVYRDDPSKGPEPDVAPDRPS